jgi:type II secretory pathway component GspD/PulD (secretin)
MGEPQVEIAAAVPRSAAEATRCSVDAADLEPAKVLRLLSRQSGVNLILLSATDSKITLRLSDVPLLEIIKHISAMTGLAYLKVGDTFVIGKSDSLSAAYPAEWKAANPTPAAAPQVETFTETYRTSYVSAVQIVSALEKLYKNDIQAAAGPIQTSPTVSAIDGSKTTGVQSTTLETSAPTEALSRTVILSGTRAAVDRALALARQLDAPRAQVAISVTVHDISNDALKDLGLSWTFNGVNISEKPSNFNVGTISRTGLGASASLKALEQKNAAKLMASPSISVMDGERGFVLIGNRINFPVLVGYTQNNAPIFDRQQERVGIYLQVAASVAGDGTVTLNLYPQVSTITGYLEVNGASYPQIATREAQTTVRVASGESIVLGGLMRDEEVAQVDKVPLLSQIPFLGELFRHRKVTKTSSQVILTVTPTVILPEPSK